MKTLKNLDRDTIFYYGFIITFTLLYAATAFVSWYHAITFFNITNAVWLSVILSFVAEIGQASALFDILITKKQKFLTWAVMSILTTLQVIGNVVSSYDWIIKHNSEGVEAFQKSILFWMQTADPEIFKVVIAWIAGALLPIIALSMTSLVAQTINTRDEEKKEALKLSVKSNDPVIDAKDIISEVSKVRPTEEEISTLEKVLNKKVPIVEPPKIVNEEVIPDYMNPEAQKERLMKIIASGDKRAEDTPIVESIKTPEVNSLGMTEDDISEYNRGLKEELHRINNEIKEEDEVPPPDQLTNEEIDNSLLGIEFSSTKDNESSAVIPHYSDEELSKMFMDEYEKTGSYYDDEESDDLDREVERLTPEIIEPEEKDLPTQDVIITHKDGISDGTLEANNTGPIGVKELLSDEDKKKLEEERLEKLRAIARENLKKK